MTKKLRLYTVEEGGRERKYFTNLKNRILNFPFTGYLWTPGADYTPEPISPGRSVVINDSKEVLGIL